jgi:hypothetical protein
MVNPIVSEYLAKLGKVGGKATGNAKRRPQSHYIALAEAAKLKAAQRRLAKANPPDSK